MPQGKHASQKQSRKVIIKLRKLSKKSSAISSFEVFGKRLLNQSQRYELTHKTRITIKTLQNMYITLQKDDKFINEENL